MSARRTVGKRAEVMIEIYYDLHIHSCLSPCGDEDMTPRNIAGMMALAGYEVIALADHNSVKNCEGIAQAAGQEGILVVPAMELCTREEVHVLCLLPDIDAANQLEQYIYTTMPNIKNRADIFGRQIHMDGQDKIIGEEERLLISAANIGIYDVYDLVKSYGGTAMPAHMDRQSFSLISNLGFYDSLMQFPVIELTADCDSAAFKKQHNITIPHIVNSDAHSLEQIPDPMRKMRLEDFSAVGVIRALEESKENPEILSL